MNFFKIKNSHKTISFALLLTLAVGFSGHREIATLAQSTALKSKYDIQKSEIDQKINTISSQINSLSADLENVSAQKNSLAEQVNEMKIEIAKTETLITETKIAINKLEEQIAENQKKIAILETDMKNLVREIQKQNKNSPLEAILSSKNLGEVLSNAYNLSSIQEKAAKINKQLEIATSELDENKKQQQETEKSLTETQYLLNSKKDSLNILLIKTQGQEDRYQELLIASKDQQKTVLAQSLQVDSDFKTAVAKENEELERQRQAEAARNSKNNSNIITSNGDTAKGAYGYESNGSGCNFTEKGKLTAPAGYFIWPTSGYVSQNYGCPSSAGGSHDAFDIANSSGTQITAVAAGSVMQKGFHAGGFGYFIIIRHVLPSGQRVYSLYAHMLQQSTASGVVSQGQIIGYMGSTGSSTGSHTHFMLISDSIETTGSVGCNYGSSKCFDPATFLP
jgi:septal ring factor EnvC (AmiA/AmiB activator)